jgi:ABC-type branched-subunit amino acid transport system substrate-binding protein
MTEAVAPDSRVIGEPVEAVNLELPADTTVTTDVVVFETTPASIPTTLGVPSTVPVTVPPPPPTAPPTTPAPVVTAPPVVVTVTVTVPVVVTVPATAPRPTAPPKTAPPPTAPPPTAPPATAPPTTAAPTVPVEPTPAPTTKKPAATKKSTKKGASTTAAVPVTPAAPTAPGITAGFDGQTITLGVIGTTTNPTWTNISKAITAGVEARVGNINKRGGIGGKYPVRLIVTDANYDAAQTVNEINTNKSKVVGFASILGTPNVEAALPALNADRLLASPASQEARWADQGNLLPVGNSYQIQAINGIAYYLEQSGNPQATVCAVSIGTTFGDAGTEGFKFAQTQLPFKPGPVVVLPPTEVNVTRALGELRAANCQAIVATVSPLQLLPLVVGAARIGWAPRWLAMGAGFSDRLITSQTSPIFEPTVWVLGDGTQWGDASTAGMGKLSTDLLGANHKFWTENPDVGLSFGYVQMRTWEDVLERAVRNNDLSRNGLLTATSQVAPIDMEGLGASIDYQRLPRTVEASATIFAVDGSYRNSIRVIAPRYRSNAAAAYRR